MELKGLHFSDVAKIQEAVTDELNIWRRNYFFLILAHSLYKM